MNKKIIVWVLGVVVVVIIISLLIIKNDKKVESVNNLPKQNNLINSDNNVPVKEFSMTSFTEMINGEPKPQFSLKEIVVNKGDIVRIKITETSGVHDFKIDEFGVYTDTPLNKESVVEFTADKAGEFIYYCTKPMHRQNGQWGTLKVI